MRRRSFRNQANGFRLLFGNAIKWENRYVRTLYLSAVSVIGIGFALVGIGFLIHPIYFQPSNVQGSTTTAKVYYIHDDAMGGANVLSNAASGTLAEVIEYYPFGGIRFALAQWRPLP